MVTETTKHAMWDGLLEASRAARYYSVIAERHARKKRTRIWLQAIAGGIAALSIAWIPSFITHVEIIVTIGGLLIILTVVLERMLTDQSELLSFVQSDLSRISGKYNRLFYLANNDQIDESVARYAHEDLLDLLHRDCVKVNVPIDKELAVETQQEAFATEKERYSYEAT